MEILCRRCLFSDEEASKTYQKIQAYIAGLSEEEKAVPEVYEERKAVCRECDCLINGMCKKCGCFIEVRAVKVHATCPHELPRW